MSLALVQAPDTTDIAHQCESAVIRTTRPGSLRDISMVGGAEEE